MEVILRCPQCGKSDSRYRLKTEDHVCNKCGKVWKVDVKEVEEN
jgi:ribosomal protein L37AE/L43A